MTKRYYDKMWGKPVSEYGLENGFCDYGTIARAFDCVSFTPSPEMFERLELMNGEDYNENEEPAEIFQWYFINRSMCEDLSRITDEIFYYDPLLDTYIWGVTHYGTSWDYVLTDIPLREIEE